jgi:hypothetical protein
MTGGVGQRPSKPYEFYGVVYGNAGLPMAACGTGSAALAPGWRLRVYLTRDNSAATASCG